MDNRSNTLAQRLRRARADLGITQAELSRASRILPPIISRMEKGLQLHCMDETRLAVALGVRPEWLCLGTGPMRDIPARLELALLMDDIAALPPRARAQVIDMVHRLADK